MMSLTFYGGVDEIGGNKVLLEDGDARVFLDFGQSFTMGCALPQKRRVILHHRLRVFPKLDGPGCGIGPAKKDHQVKERPRIHGPIHTSKLNPRGPEKLLRCLKSFLTTKIRDHKV